MEENVKKVEKANWLKINAGGYGKEAFHLFQEDFVKENITEALEIIENGNFM